MRDDSKVLLIPQNRSTHCWKSEYLIEANNAIVQHSKNNVKAKSFNKMAVKLTPEIEKIKDNEKNILSPEEYDEKRRQKQNLKKEILNLEQQLKNKVQNRRSLLDRLDLSPDMAKEEIVQMNNNFHLAVKSNIKAGHGASEEEKEKLEGLKNAVIQYQDIEDLQREIHQKKAQYRLLKEELNKTRNIVILAMTSVAKVLSSYKSQSNDKKSNRSSAINNWKAYILKDLQTLKKQKNTDTNDDKTIKV